MTAGRGNLGRWRVKWNRIISPSGFLSPLVSHLPSLLSRTMKGGRREEERRDGRGGGMMEAAA